MAQSEIYRVPSGCNRPDDNFLPERMKTKKLHGAAIIIEESDKLFER